ncbi:MULTISPECIES: hypothetical protein [unclassified Methylophaga]|jgi:hypothetical protein|uniref:hypothetical protein n=1 Tax=unclassified Methylophaga TaxID=2629249 RepID=UPI000C6A1A2A|nr:MULTISPECIES: hypothetical protein [unclassified Methylophaga]MAL49146.1 hypothetical protein [Methylophaga sp.]MBP24475.1 hypothetical protein [Methylophaga sp.]MDX1751219.1 hypothetical protein [Methylophaga sp.]HCC81916.1 hypothetical protein [Methylophaga sp.]|tara:strand:- start:595 stop:1167 length:573 start_codon:yes stop_codon:yes gene_type:complete
MVSNDLNNSSTPNWASILGVVAIMLGVFLTAMHGTEIMKQYVMTSNMPVSGEMPEADCPLEELEEEGISVAECEYLVAHVQGVALSTPDWFPSTMMTLAAAGTLLAFASVIIGGALVNYTPWSSAAAVVVFIGLAVVDLLQFSAVVSTGPILRDMYLWSILLWFILHLMLLVGAIAGRHTEAARVNREVA